METSSTLNIPILTIRPAGMTINAEADEYGTYFFGENAKKVASITGLQVKYDYYQEGSLWIPAPDEDIYYPKIVKAGYKIQIIEP